MRAKKPRRMPVFSLFLFAITVAGIAALWFWLPFLPSFTIGAESDSLLLGFSADGTALVTQGINALHQHWTGPIQLWSVASQTVFNSLAGEVSGFFSCPQTAGFWRGRFPTPDRDSMSGGHDRRGWHGSFINWSA